MAIELLPQQPDAVTHAVQALLTQDAPNVSGWWRAGL